MVILWQTKTTLKIKSLTRFLNTGMTVFSSSFIKIKQRQQPKIKSNPTL